MAEKEEDKGFVIKDRRRFAEDAETDRQAPEEKAAEAGEQKTRKPVEPGPEESQEEYGFEHGPFPEVSMATFIFSLSSSALVHLGEIPEPETNRAHMDLAMAKQIIDTLGMLEDKTKGNLDQDEERLMKSVLYDLRMRYVQKSTGK